jgi:general stress protein YciG
MNKKGRGFAGMDKDRQREIASQGGKAAHAQGVAHEWTPEEARIAGLKGAEVTKRKFRNQQPGEGNGQG